MALINAAVWGVVGTFWWKFLGLYWFSSWFRFEYVCLFYVTWFISSSDDLCNDILSLRTLIRFQFCRTFNYSLPIQRSMLSIFHLKQLKISPAGGWFPSFVQPLPSTFGWVEALHDPYLNQKLLMEEVECCGRKWQSHWSRMNSSFCRGQEWTVGFAWYCSWFPFNLLDYCKWFRIWRPTNLIFIRCFYSTCVLYAFDHIYLNRTTSYWYIHFL